MSRLQSEQDKFPSGQEYTVSSICSHQPFAPQRIQLIAASATSYEAELKIANIILTLLCLMYLGRISGQLSMYSDSLRAEPYRYRIPLRDRFFASVQTGPGSHPASHTMETVPFSGVKQPGRDVDYPHLAQRLKKGYSYNFNSLLGLRGNFTFVVFYFTTLPVA